MNTDQTTQLQEITLDQADEIRYAVVHHINGINYLYKEHISSIVDAICKNKNIKRTPIVENIVEAAIEDYFGK